MDVEEFFRGFPALETMDLSKLFLCYALALQSADGTPGTRFYIWEGMLRTIEHLIKQRCIEDACPSIVKHWFCVLAISNEEMLLPSSYLQSLLARFGSANISCHVHTEWTAGSVRNPLVEDDHHPYKYVFRYDQPNPYITHILVYATLDEIVAWGHEQCNNLVLTIDPYQSSHQIVELYDD